MDAQFAPKLTIATNAKGLKRSVSLCCMKMTLSVYESGKLSINVPFEQILWCQISLNNMLELSLLRKQHDELVLFTVSGSFAEAFQEEAARFVEFVMEKAYGDSPPQRKFKVLVNPKGGPGKAGRIFGTKVKAMFEAARCPIDVIVTQYPRHGYEIAKNIPLGVYDGIAVLSGDGLIHEILNGLADHENPALALEIPFIPLPAGSANGFSVALLGLEDGLDVGAAVLNAIKGKKMKIDLCSVTQNGKRSISFLTQTVGIMADLDLGTEHLRWMGETRFVAGYLFWAVVLNRSRDMKLEIKTTVRNKQDMVKTFKSSRSSKSLTDSSSSSSNGSEGITEEWITIDRPIGYMYAGKIPFVSKDLMQFPLALCDDGFIDLVVQEKMPRINWLKNMDEADKGKQYWLSSQHYYKARAYRLTPHTTEGHLSIDGERFQYAPFEVEVLPRLGTTFGNGSWAINKFYEPNSK